MQVAHGLPGKNRSSGAPACSQLLSGDWPLATFFFVIPDVFFSFVTILDWPRTWRYIPAAIGGALLGGALLFHWASADSAAARAAVARVAFIRENMFAKVDDGFRNQGLLSVLLGSVSGLPYKLYAVEARNLRARQNFFWRLRRHARFASSRCGPALARSHLG